MIKYLIVEIYFQTECSNFMKFLLCVVKWIISFKFISLLYLILFFIYYLKFFCFACVLLLSMYMHVTFCYIFLSPCTLLKGNKSQSWGITRAASGVRSRTKPGRLAGCLATTSPPSTVWTSSPGTMDRFPEMPPNTCSAVASMAASLLEKVKVVQVKGQSLYGLKDGSTITELVMTQTER